MNLNFRKNWLKKQLADSELYMHRISQFSTQFLLKCSYKGTVASMYSKYGGLLNYSNLSWILRIGLVLGQLGVPFHIGLVGVPGESLVRQRIFENLEKNYLEICKNYIILAYFSKKWKPNVKISGVWSKNTIGWEFLRKIWKVLIKIQ